MAHGSARARSVSFVLEQCLAPIPGGTGRYTKEIAAALAAVDDERTVIGWTAAHRDLSPARIRGVRGPKTLPLPRRGLIAAWDIGSGPVPRGADLVHAPTMLVPPRRRKPLVVTIHDAVPWTHPETLTPRGASWHRRVGERVAKQADAIVVPSQAVVDQLVEFIDIGAKTSVIGLGVSRDLDPPADADIRATRLDLPETYLLSVATLEPRKGLDVLLAALANPSAPKVPLLVVGQPGWGGVDLAKEASRLGLPADRVRVMGRLSDVDLAVTFARAGVLVAPSRSEGFGIPVLEAMAAGTPVIHSDAPALVEVAGGAGVVVPVGESRLLAEAIRGVIDDPGTQQRLRSLGLRRASDFSWEKSARALWQLYDDVLDNA